MKSIRLFPLLVSVLAMFLTQRAEAQGLSSPYYYSTQPRVSPYINLLRQGSAPGVNYYGLVRPEIEFRRNIQQLQGQTLNQQQAITGLQTTTSAVVTGHPVGFQTQGSYFQNLSSPGAFAFTAGTTQPRAGAAAPGAPSQPRRGR